MDRESTFKIIQFLHIKKVPAETCLICSLAVRLVKGKYRQATNKPSLEIAKVGPSASDVGYGFKMWDLQGENHLCLLFFLTKY